MCSLKIALLSDTFLHNPNGVSSSLVLLHRELSRLGHDVWIIAPSLGANRVEDSRVIRLRSLAYPFYPSQRIALPFGSIAPPGLDIVHTHTPLTVGLMGIRLARRYRIPHVATIHVDYESYLHYVPALSSINKVTHVVPRMIRSVYQGADLVLTPSRSTMTVAQSYGIERPMEVVPNGVDIQYLKSAPEINCPWPRGARRLLAISRLGQEKSVHNLVKALSHLAACNHNVHLVIVGEGPEERRLFDLSCELGVRDRLTIRPSIPFFAIGAYYRDAEVLLSASATETQGMVLWEAQAMGVPVVAAASGGAAEAVLNEQTGYLVPVGDPEALARATSKILMDSGGKSWMAERARTWGRQRSSEVMAAEVVSAYQRAQKLHRQSAFG